MSEEEFDFDAALEKAAKGPEPEDTPADRIQPVSEETPPEEEKSEPAQETKEAVEEAAAAPDPLKAIHDKFGNDPNKLAEAYGQLEKKLGSMGQELGQLRSNQEQTNQWLNEQRELARQQAAEPMSQDDLDEKIEMNPQQVALEAVRTGDEQQYRYIIDQWLETDPTAAMDFNTQYRVAQATQGLQKQQQPLIESHKDNEFVGAWQQVAAANPEIDQLGDAMLKVAQNDPVLGETVSRAFNTGTAEQKQAAIRTLMYAAKGSTLQEVQAPTENLEQEKKDAEVLHSQGPNPTPAGDAAQKQAIEDWKKETFFGDELDAF